MGCGQCQQQAAPRDAHPTRGCFPLRLHERSSNVETGTQMVQRVLPDPLPSASPTPRPLPAPTLHGSHLSQ